VIDLAFAEARKLISHGKKLRGALIVLGYDITQGDPSLLQLVLDVSVGYEFAHNAFLVHDDIMDRAPIRRNEQTTWKVFAEQIKGDDDHYGISQAINVGDMMGSWLPALIGRKEFGAAAICSALRILRDIVHTTTLGQTLDINPGISLDQLSYEYVDAIARSKTALYTIAGPLQMGAALAGSPDHLDRHDAFAGFGIPIGVAFQYQDDVLGMYGSREELGKSVSSDLSEAKKTALFLEIHRRLDGPDRERFVKLWGGANISESEVEWVRRMGRETGALETVQCRAREFVATAETAIPRISEEPHIQSLLRELASFVVERTY
jgi:geranylgeranyl diphosphate synthase type I